MIALGAGSQVIAACGGEDDGPDEVGNEQWEQRAAELEGSQDAVYTNAAPGPWAGKEGSHVPSLIADGEARIETAHGQTVNEPDTEDHYITTLYVRDQDGVVIHLVELDGTEEAPTTSFTPPEGTTEMTAFSHCNLHGLWSSDPVTV
jgi:desulfoferrodoxin (superoxide reductase-like protein)